MLAALFTFGSLLVVAHSQDLQYLGTLSTLAHGINGEVYAEDDHTIVIKSFVYDGESEDAFFVLSKTEKVEEPLEYLADELGLKDPLGTYMNEDIRLRLRPGTQLSDYKTLAVYCNKYQINFGSVIFGQIPKPMVRSLIPMGKFDEKASLHHISGEVLAIDERTLMLKGFNYDGMSEDGQFVLFRDEKRINETMDMLADEEGTTNPMVLYRDMDVILNLNPGTKLSQYTGFAIYCGKYNIVFGSVVFPEHKRLPRATRRAIRAMALGPLVTGNSNHNVTGNVFRIDDRTILITRFTYDGMSPDGQIVLSQKKDMIAEPIEIIGDERGNMGPLRKYDGQTLFVKLNQGTHLADFQGLGIYCAKYKQDFAHVFFPTETKITRVLSILSAKVNMAGAKKLGTFRTLGHNVSGEAWALDDSTILLKNFSYDGTSKDGRFVLSKTTAIEEPLENLGDEWGSKDGILEYVQKDMVIRLNAGTKLSDFKALGVYCADYKLDFGHVIFGSDMSGLTESTQDFKQSNTLGAGSMW